MTQDVSSFSVFRRFLQAILPPKLEKWKLMMQKAVRVRPKKLSKGSAEPECWWKKSQKDQSLLDVFLCSSHFDCWSNKWNAYWPGMLLGEGCDIPESMRKLELMWAQRNQLGRPSRQDLFLVFAEFSEAAVQVQCAGGWTEGGADRRVQDDSAGPHQLHHPLHRPHRGPRPHPQRVCRWVRHTFFFHPVWTNPLLDPVHTGHRPARKRQMEPVVVHTGWKKDRSWKQICFCVLCELPSAPCELGGSQTNKLDWFPRRVGRIDQWVRLSNAFFRVH